MAVPRIALRDLGDAIRVQRNAAGISQSELGKRAGIVGKYVSEIERGTRDIPFSTLFAIVEALGLRLGVKFERGKRRQPAKLPGPVQRVAQDLAGLPDARRSQVLAIVRRVLALAR